MKEGLAKLHTLREDLKNAIATKYGSLEEFYDLIYALESAQYTATVKNKDAAVSNKITAIMNEIEDDLENMGAFDGRDITTAIISDFTGIIAQQYAERIANYLKSRQ